MDRLHDEVTLYRTPTGFLCFSHHYPIYAIGHTLQDCLDALYANMKALLTSGRRTVSKAVSSTVDAEISITDAYREPAFQIHIFDNGWERCARKVQGYT